MSKSVELRGAALEIAQLMDFSRAERDRITQEAEAALDELRGAIQIKLQKQLDVIQCETGIKVGEANRRPQDRRPDET
jgi:hypothetical protein